MVIEITKRYIIGEDIFENIMNDYTNYYDYMGKNFNFDDFLYEELEDIGHDEKIINGDIEQIKEMCELQMKLDKLKEKLLS